MIACAGCGAAKPPTYQLTQSEAAIRGAEEIGASNVPKAALHLKMARDYVEAAQKLISDQQGYDEARALLKRAEADAELAIALSREAQAREETEEAVRRVLKLRKELD